MIGNSTIMREKAGIVHHIKSPVNIDINIIRQQNFPSREFLFSCALKYHPTSHIRQVFYFVVTYIWCPRSWHESGKKINAIFGVRVKMNSDRKVKRKFRSTFYDVDLLRAFIFPPLKNTEITGKLWKRRHQALRSNKPVTEILVYR